MSASGQSTLPVARPPCATRSHKFTACESLDSCPEHRTDITKFPDGAAIEMSRFPLTWWKAAGNKYGFLRLLARATLAAPATSAPVERWFSECSLIMTTKRNRMSPAKLSLLTFLNRSWHVAIATQGPSWGYLKVNLIGLREESVKYYT